MLFIYMSKYPGVILFRHNNYSEVDSHIEENKENLMCTIHITNNIEDLNKLFNPNYHILVTYGSSYDEYHNCIASKLPERFSGRWFHKTDISNIDEFNHNVNYCFVTNVINCREHTRPVFSIFTTCFKSYDYIKTAYESIKKQSLIDWEWVIMDDTPEDCHFDFLKSVLSADNRVRLYNRDKNSGNIGNVKNEVIALCRGKYILEMDHDDEILENCLTDAYNIFQTDEDIGFVYGDTIHLYRDGKNYKFNDFICKGYGGYYMEKINDNWVYVYNTPNINNITLSHLVCLPNHPRIWKRSVLMELESYSEFLPICDDYEILLRTCCSKYKVAKNNKAQYIQYANDDGNNFSSIRNSEINRIGPKYISPMFYNKYGVHDKMKDLDAYEEESYVTNHSHIWKRGDKYQHKKMNQRINLNYDKQYCIINDAIDTPETMERVRELYKNGRNDFLFLSNCMTHEEMYHKLESLGFDRMKCYSYNDCSEEELVNYFKMMYKNDNCEHEVIQSENDLCNNFITDNIVNLNLLDTEDIKSKFTTTDPFNHIVLDNIINTTILNKALDEIKSIHIDQLVPANVYGIDNVQTNKFSYTDFNKLKYISEIKKYFESDIFINWLERITGINNLQKDINIDGGGIHIMKNNGTLGIHNDCNMHHLTKKYRRVNLLLYLNKDYDETYNGHLELWNAEMTVCKQKISPIFNRIVLFRVDDNANHGHPALWKGGVDDRISLALYYYTDDRPEHEKSETISAVWKKPNPDINKINYLTNNTSLTTRHEVVNTIIDTYNYNSYLEIGVENGFTFKNIKLDMSKKVGVDPDPTYKEDNIILKTSDDFFKENNKIFDIIFIDGMHQLEFVYNDFFNAINCLTPKGSIIIDDVLPMNEREQYKVPIKHYYNNGILKYGESWTGDVWKFIYFLLLHYQFDFSVYNFTDGYRGIIHIYNFKNEINDDIDNTKVIETMNSYDYNTDYDKYLKYINEYCKNS